MTENSHYYIENSTANDIEKIYWLFEQAKIFHEKNSYPAWKNFDNAVLEKDINNGQHYKIVANNQIACIFSVLYADPFIWRQREKGDAIYLHRIVVHPDYRGQKHFEKIISWAVNHAKQKNLKYIRMDTWADNPKLISYYKQFGFYFLENYITPNTEDLPPQNRNLNHALLEFEVK